jgi:hypothetical protein
MALAVVLGLAVGCAWIYAGWGAYRELNGLSRVRSIVAATIFAVLWFPINALLFFIANAGAQATPVTN